MPQFLDGVGVRDKPHPALRTGQADLPHPALQNGSLSTRLQDHSPGFHQTVKPELVKIGIRPALMVTPSGSALLSLMLAQDASQAFANPTVQFAERRGLAVFEVFKPASQQW